MIEESAHVNFDENLPKSQPDIGSEDEPLNLPTAMTVKDKNSLVEAVEPEEVTRE